MNVTFACPHCGQTAREPLASEQSHLACPHCGRHWEIPSGALSASGVRRCVVCPSSELFVRKDFPQRLGVTIVVLGFALSCVTWYFERVAATFAVLFATALIDVLLYALVGNVLECYRCQAQYRGLSGLEQYEPFNLETFERHRQQAARLAQTPKTTSPPAGS